MVTIIHNCSALSVTEDESGWSSSAVGDDGEYEVFDSPPLRRRGRPKKKRRKKVRAIRKSRGRDIISESWAYQDFPRPSVDSPEVCNTQAPPPSVWTSSQCGGYLTRAKKAWLLAKVVGMEFPGSDLEAIQGLAEQIAEASCNTRNFNENIITTIVSVSV